jgi:hypothetical protein
LKYTQQPTSLETTAASVFTWTPAGINKANDWLEEIKRRTTIKNLIKLITGSCFYSIYHYAAKYIPENNYIIIN